MRSILTQDHPTNVRDLMIRYGLDKLSVRVADFTTGKNGFWETDWPYKCEIVKCDGDPEAELAQEHRIIKKDLTTDDYSDLYPLDGGFFDPPYLRGRQATDQQSRQKKGKNVIVPAGQQGKNSWSAEGKLDRYVTNLTDQEFIDRVKGVDRACLQCFKPDGVLIVKVQDTRGDGFMVPNHFLIMQNLPSFRLHWIAVYLKAGGQIWKHPTETSHGYYMVFKLQKDGRQAKLV